MSILGAMNAGVGGLNAQSKKFGAISDNIANSQSVGYKRKDVQFPSLVTGSGQQAAATPGGVGTDFRVQVSREGSLIASDNETDLAVAGQGFFVVSDRENGGDTGRGLLTRAGSFRPDENGNLVNAAGHFLQGWALDESGAFVGGEPARTGFNGLETVNVRNLSFTGEPTTQVGFSANLPSQLTGDPTAGNLRTSVEYFDDLGTARRLTLDWNPDDTVANRWQLTLEDDTGAIGTIDVDFNGTGANAGSPSGYTPGAPIAAGADPGTFTVPVNGAANPITLTLGEPNTFSGLTQFSGDYVPNNITKDGSAFGSVNNVEIADDGTVFAVFDNGTRRPAYQLPLANVTNPDGLGLVDGNAFELGRDAGEMFLWDAGTGPVGDVAPASLEQSNVDIAEELTSLITTQRAYNSNATIIRTADEMLTTANQLKR